MDGKEIYVLYGSQTGQAEAIAENIHEAAEAKGLRSSLLNLRKADEAFQIIFEPRQALFIFVCSTTGEGELPGTARKFMRILGRKTHPPTILTHLRYALLGLGDTNYSTFCGGPKTLERGLKKLGATSFYPTGFADDGTDLELVVEPWIEGLWMTMKDESARLFSERTILSHGNRQEADNVPSSMCVGNEGISSDQLVHVSLEKSSDQSSAKNTLQNFTAGEVGNSLKNLSLEDTYLAFSESPLRRLSETSSGTLPPLMQSYIEYSRTPGERPNNGNFVPYPLADSDAVKTAAIVSIEKLTSDDAIKTAYYVTLDVGDDFLYEPGDSFGVIVKNPKEEVDWLIKRLKLFDHCDDTITIKVRETMIKKKIPKYIPIVSTMRNLLENCIEIRSVPKRTFLRSLYDFTTSEVDQNILRQLCRKESMEDFSKFVREPNLNLLDLLASLPSCQPPFELLIEQLPRIKARLYSAASALEAEPGNLKFVFNVVEIPVSDGRMYPRKGVFTGFMNSVYHADARTTSLSIFKCKNPSFRLPSPINGPVVMIGPGTGIAPYIGFLEYIKCHFVDKNATGWPQTWLFYGCRHREKDFLFRNKLDGFEKSGILVHLLVAYSRDSDGIYPRYVQDNLRLKSDKILELLLGNEAVFYVCGDAKNMAKDVRRCIVDILTERLSADGANERLNLMVKEGRYKEDVWT